VQWPHSSSRPMISARNRDVALTWFELCPEVEYKTWSTVLIIGPIGRNRSASLRPCDRARLNLDLPIITNFISRWININRSVLFAGQFAVFLNGPTRTIWTLYSAVYHHRKGHQSYIEFYHKQHFSE
jgi:hypothetical protein